MKKLPPKKPKKAVEPKKDLTKTVDFLFEAGMLSKTPRSWSGFLGSGRQSVAEHLNRTTYIGFVLSHMAGNVDVAKVVQMCMFHDFSEARISDLNYVHQKYTERLEHKAIEDLVTSIPFGPSIKKLIDEYEERKTPESIIAKDSDNIEFILALKEEKDAGNSRAASWLPSAVQRLKTKEAKELATKILEIESDHWWFGDKDDKWWVSRNKK